ncbi:hypothetical protein [Streptomyces abikoensis]|uniref:hypothetical protein n=1 Tax=Streptomyces abikoensis TaxID=97398 RepID=UPI00167BD836|nr:hypothetical protein [Streptomyces abikoensis]GGP36770.1 hypothetical protein GCM10010214_07150 [Streptomyces abikoensis]
MALLRWSSAFDNIEAHVLELRTGPDLDLAVPGRAQPMRLSPAEARNALHGVPSDEGLRNSIWSSVITRARRDDTARSDWQLYAAWLAIPALRRTVHEVSSRLGSERSEVEAEMLVALLEELETAEPEQPDPGLMLLKAVRTRAWRAARRLPEVAVADTTVTEAFRRGPGHGVELYVPAPVRRGKSLAPLRITMSRSQREGELLGAVAHRLGLRDLVSAAAGTRRGHRIGTLPLRQKGGPR